MSQITVQVLQLSCNIAKVLYVTSVFLENRFHIRSVDRTVVYSAVKVSDCTEYYVSITYSFCICNLFELQICRHYQEYNTTESKRIDYRSKEVPSSVS